MQDPYDYYDRRYEDEMFERRYASGMPSMRSSGRDFVPPPSLTAEEQTLLDYFRDASKEVRRAALGALIGAPTGSAIHQGGTHSQHSSGTGAIHIGTAGTVPTKRR